MGPNYLGQAYFGQYYGDGIQFDATSGSGYQAASSSYSWTHTIGAGAHQLLVVSVGMLSAANSVTGITYNSVPLTKLRSDVSASTTVRTEIWYLVGPASGAHSVAVTLNTASVSGATASSYNNTDPNAPVDAQNGGTDITGAGGGSSSISTTTVTNGAWLVDVIATVDTTVTPTNLQTARGNITGAAGSAGMSEKNPIAIGGTSVAMGWDNIAALTTWTMSTLAIKPFTGQEATTTSTSSTSSSISTSSTSQSTSTSRSTSTSSTSSSTSTSASTSSTSSSISTSSTSKSTSTSSTSSSISTSSTSQSTSVSTSTSTTASITTSTSSTSSSISTSSTSQSTSTSTSLSTSSTSQSTSFSTSSTSNSTSISTSSTSSSTSLSTSSTSSSTSTTISTTTSTSSTSSSISTSSTSSSTSTTALDINFRGKIKQPVGLHGPQIRLDAPRGRITVDRPIGR